MAGYRNAMVAAELSNSSLGHTNGLRKCYSHLVEASFLAVVAIWALNGCLVGENADQCKFING